MDDQKYLTRLIEGHLGCFLFFTLRPTIFIQDPWGLLVSKCRFLFQSLERHMVTISYMTYIPVGSGQNPGMKHNISEVTGD